MPGGEGIFPLRLVRRWTFWECCRLKVRRATLPGGEGESPLRLVSLWAFSTPHRLKAALHTFGVTAEGGAIEKNSV
jgi:hypothetical protein